MNCQFVNAKIALRFPNKIDDRESVKDQIRLALQEAGESATQRKTQNQCVCVDKAT
jgi:hypothetical protein